MGCDIHAHVEVKIEGQWHHYAKPNVNRSYALFGRMAGVRGEGEPISEPRGMPNDATFMTLFDRKYWDTDGHSDSWLSSDEVASLNEWVKSFGEQRSGFFAETQFGFIFGNGWDVKKYPDDYPKGLEDARLVFWFDNYSAG